MFSLKKLLVMIASHRTATVDVDLSSSITAYSSETKSFVEAFEVASDVTHCCLSRCSGSSSLARDVQVGA